MYPQSSKQQWAFMSHIWD